MNKRTFVRFTFIFIFLTVPVLLAPIGGAEVLDVRPPQCLCVISEFRNDLFGAGFVSGMATLTEGL